MAPRGGILYPGQRVSGLDVWRSSRQRQSLPEHGGDLQVLAPDLERLSLPGDGSVPHQVRLFREQIQPHAAHM